VIEGPPRNVLTLFKAIKADDRHTSIKLHLAHPITRRTFPRFSTGEQGHESEHPYMVGSFHHSPSCDSDYHAESGLEKASASVIDGDDLVTLQYKSVMENPGAHADTSQALDVVIEIAEQAQVSNAAMLITGILVYNEATREVIQILEGPRDNVLKLLDCIRQDPRHHLDSAQDLSISDIDTRSFGQWNMSLVKLHEGSTSRRRRGVQPCAANVEEQMIKGNLKVPFRDVKVFDEALSDPELSPGVF